MIRNHSTQISIKAGSTHLLGQLISMDEELERLKRKKMAEIQKRMSQRSQPEVQPQTRKEPTNDEILSTQFGDRAWEVWKAAKEQFPTVMPQVEVALVDAIKTRKLTDKIDGANLMGFLRQIGLSVRLNTQIRYAEHGELKTLEQKLKSE